MADVVVSSKLPTHLLPPPNRVAYLSSLYLLSDSILETEFGRVKSDRWSAHGIGNGFEVTAVQWIHQNFRFEGADR
ncbi:hypothetical protein SAY86_008203 [Trapa natans]|uniref:Uncharacterized protein n=1 Tax=Trapa natans TaxID=22666 RepID=A0AAN7K831_TRANT|nr:hypothetical protein SAY86_008203 [Trapa natans]